jgi:DNA repair protein RecN (Recombination protein N)
MELPFAAFEVSITDAPLGISGKDSVSFMFSATGRNVVEVSRCASGGELSRIMLALKAMLARYKKMPTMIFDEIDTGVSGSVADKMGSVICAMGSYMQVFAITHLPQVAAKGSAHYMVSKEIDPASSKAVSTISRLSDQERLLEVARMLSGSVMTDAAIENARELLKG